MKAYRLVISRHGRLLGQFETVMPFATASSSLDRIPQTSARVAQYILEALGLVAPSNQ